MIIINFLNTKLKTMKKNMLLFDGLTVV